MKIVLTVNEKSALQTAVCQIFGGSLIMKRAGF